MGIGELMVQRELELISLGESTERFEEFCCFLEPIVPVIDVR